MSLDLEQRIKSLRVTTTADVDRRILADASAVLESVRLNALGARQSNLWRSVMRSKWTKLAAAILIATGLATIMFNREMSAVAYALEQTLEANLGLRSIHIRIEPSGDGMSEAWAKFDDKGNLERLRMSFPKTEDGPKEVVWQKDKAEVWFKRKKAASVVHEPEILKRMPEMLAMFDPRVATEQIYAAQAKGDAVIETQAPSKEGEPIELIVNFKKPREERIICHVNPDTKLVEQLEKYRLEKGEYKLLFRQEYLDYNQEIPAEVFVMDIPADVMRVDTTTQEIGLAKGDLSDKEIAVKVAREFFEALVAKDYAKAGVIYSGIPAAKMEEMFGKIEFLRIVSVGEAEPHPDPRTQSLRVPCEVEIRYEGRTLARKFMPAIRAEYNLPDRWVIHGGI